MSYYHQPDKAVLHGVLSYYGASPQRHYPFFTSGDLDSKKCVLFIGGLYNGLMDPPYLVALSDKLKQMGWKLVQMHWSGAYDGFGTGSLDRDVKEMSNLVTHLRKLGNETIILMGHSTGSQDVIHYLTSPLPPPAPSPTSSSDTQPRPVERAPVQGGIMQAPASDREYFAHDNSPDNEQWKKQLPIAEKLVSEGKGDTILDDEFCKNAGCRMTAYRLKSLIGVGGDDDYFSSDLPLDPTEPFAHPLSSSFGKLSVPALALWSEKDEYSYVPDAVAHLKRWEDAGRGKLEWRVVEGANHGVGDAEPQAKLCAAVEEWLTKHFA